MYKAGTTEQNMEGGGGGDKRPLKVGEIRVVVGYPPLGNFESKTLGNAIS